MAVATSPTTFGLLGMLAVRSWTGYELAKQMRRSLRFVWSSSEGHLYREQKRLVELGWAEVEVEPSGGRSRKRYTITPAGEAALRSWLATPPQEPHFEVEGLLRLFFSDHGTLDDMITSMEATAEPRRVRCSTSCSASSMSTSPRVARCGCSNTAWADTAAERLEFRGRPMFPERLHVVALVIDATTRLLADVETFARATANEARTWRGAADPTNTAATRTRLEAISARYRASA